MPSITFQPQLRSVRDILSTNFYAIPRFQRPYSWTQENLDDFLQDVTESEEEGYFIGPMVSFDQGKRLSAIVDGQQRITTITIVLCVLRDKFISIGEHRLGEALQRYIEREDDDSVAHFVLRADAAGTYLKSQIQTEGPRTAVKAISDEQRALKRAYDEIAMSLEKKLEGLDVEIEATDEVSPASAELRRIRDKILTLQVIWIQLDTEDDAYMIFETLNSRGKDLEVVDLLKNHLLSGIKAENGDLDTARLTWTEIREILEAAKANPNKFILHWWLSRGAYTAERKLYKLLRTEIPDSECWSTLLALRSDVALYAKIASPQNASWAPHEAGLRESLEALELFGVRQPRPLLLALLRAYDSDLIKYKACAAAVQVVESYHFITTAIVGVSSTGGISQMYASAARGVTEASDANLVGVRMNQLRQKLKTSVSQRDSFLAEFGPQVKFGERDPGRKRLVQYVLRKLHRAARPGSPVDISKCNIEHLHPQSSTDSWVMELGNLFLVGSELNASLGTRPYPEKREILLRHSAIYDVSDLESAQTWGSRQVAARSRRLAELSYDEVWSLS